MTTKLGADSEMVLESKCVFGSHSAADLASDRRGEPKAQVGRENSSISGPHCQISFV